MEPYKIKVRSAYGAYYYTLFYLHCLNAWAKQVMRESCTHVVACNNVLWLTLAMQHVCCVFRSFIQILCKFCKDFLYILIIYHHYYHFFHNHYYHSGLAILYKFTKYKSYNHNTDLQKKIKVTISQFFLFSCDPTAFQLIKLFSSFLENQQIF